MNIVVQTLNHESNGALDDFGSQCDSNFQVASYDFYLQFCPPQLLELEYTGYEKANSNNSLTYSEGHTYECVLRYA